MPPSLVDTPYFTSDYGRLSGSLSQAAREGAHSTRTLRSNYALCVITALFSAMHPSIRVLSIHLDIIEGQE